jgi:hypothetical protein
MQTTTVAGCLMHRAHHTIAFRDDRAKNPAGKTGLRVLQLRHMVVLNTAVYLSSRKLRIETAMRNRLLCSFGLPVHKSALPALL